jgi:cell division septal protein FtsQ
VLLDLGRDQAKSRVSERLQRFAAVHGQATERLKARADVIDLRYPNGFAMRQGKGRNGAGRGARREMSKEGGSC